MSSSTPPPIVHVFAKKGKVWVGYSYPNCPMGIVAYEVSAAVAVSSEGVMMAPSHQAWNLSNPEKHSQWSCSTEISADTAMAYGQARVCFEDGHWSDWSVVVATQLGPKLLPNAPPLVECFSKAGLVWIRYSYPNSPGIIAYAVRAGLELSDEREITNPSAVADWSLNGPPEHDSAWACATTIDLASLPPNVPVYAQARVQVANGDWSSWSPVVTAQFGDHDEVRGFQGQGGADLLSPVPAQSLCRVLQPDGTWLEYVPHPQSVLVLAAGFNGNAERLQELGYHTTVLYDQFYDKYPDQWNQEKYLDRPLRLLPGTPYDHASFADDVALPMIRTLVANGHGPAVVITGSRGGQVTICRLWCMWQGPSVVLNGGCGIRSAPPQGVPLGLLTQGQDFFPTKHLSYTHRLFSAWPGEVVIFHHEHDDHSVRTYNDAIEFVMSTVLDFPQTREAAVGRAHSCLRGLAQEGQVFIKPKGSAELFQSVWE